MEIVVFRTDNLAFVALNNSVAVVNPFTTSLRVFAAKCA